MNKSNQSIVIPSKPKIIMEDDNRGTYEIEGLYPGYGHTLGNSLRRIILSSIPGAAVTVVKMDGVNHEFSTLEGVREDVINILLNIRKTRIKLHGESPQKLVVVKKGEGNLIAGDLNKSNSAVEIVNPEQHIATMTNKKAVIDMELTVETGLGFVTRDELKKDKVDIGIIAIDAVFTPIRRVTYEVDNMRVGDRTDFNKLQIFIETDGTITPRVALERAIYIMIEQLKAVVGFKEEEEEKEKSEQEIHSGVDKVKDGEREEKKEEYSDEDIFLKKSVEEISLSSRTSNALSNAGVRTVGGLLRKNAEALLALDGLGNKGLKEIKKVLAKKGLSLKE